MVMESKRIYLAAFSPCHDLHKIGTELQTRDDLEVRPLKTSLHQPHANI